MSNTFEFVGKILPCKVTENFKPYEKRTFDSGWSKTTLKFNAVCGNNRHLMEIGAFTPADINNTIIYTMTKGGEINGKKVKGENIQVAYKDRTKKNILESIANFKKFVVDTEIPQRRYQLKNAIDKFKEGSITDEEMKNLNVSTLEECEEALAKSEKKHHEYIWEYDFIEFLNKFITKPEINDMMWKITGNYELEYDAKNDKWYRKFKPTRIYRAEDNAEPQSHGTFSVIFDTNAVDDSDFTDTNKLHINGYLGQYLGNHYKKTCYSPIVLTVDGSKDEMTKKKAIGLKKLFTFPSDYEGEYREIGVTVELLDGAQEVSLTEDMLTDEQRENIECGLITMDDIKREIGKPVYGDKVTDIVITGLARGFTGGSHDTALTADDVTRVTSEWGDSVDVPFDIDDDDEI